MLETTNNPYIFSSSTATTTTQLPSSSASTATTTKATSIPSTIVENGEEQQHLQQKRVLQNDTYYQGQPARLNSAFNRPQEEYSHYMYKSNQRSSSPIHTLSPIKSENSPMISASPQYHKFIEDREQQQQQQQWIDNTKESGKTKRRKEMNTLMEELNQDFLKKKEKLYLDKLTTINQELSEAKQDKHALYLESLKDLEKARTKMIQDGILFREYQNQVTDNQFRLEIYQAEEEYTAETQEVREKLFNILEEKRRKLKEDKDNCDLAYDVVMESSSRLHKRNLRKRGNEHLENKSNKKKQTTGPAFVFKLKDDDVVSDLQAMKTGISMSPSSSTTTATTDKKLSSLSKKK